MNMTGIIFSEMCNDNLNAFTLDRNMAAIPFGGRYRLVDFPLSNMVNSGITNVAVVAKQHYHSLMDHLSKSQEWDLNRKNGGLLILPPFVNGSFSQTHRGKLDDLRNALIYLEDADTPYVLLADAHVIYNLDYLLVLQSHIDSGCDITLAATCQTEATQEPYGIVMEAGDDLRATSFAVDTQAAPGAYTGMGVCIMSREKLIQVVRDYTARGSYDLYRDFVQAQFNQGNLSINVYHFQDVVLHIRNAEEYIANNLSLTQPEIASALFRTDAPIYTRVHDEVPAYYGMDCDVSGCIIADGCIIEGSAQHCVISRGVRIGKGAVVKDCIIMQGSVVGEGAVLEHVVVDKWATISAGTELKGAPNSPVIIRKGATV